MKNIHHIDQQVIDWTIIRQLIDEDRVLELSPKSREKVLKCRAYLDKRMKQDGDSLYGINTGFGSLCNKVISASDLGLLQKNLVMSHACGVGETVPEEITRLMLFLKVQSLSYGNSGVQLATVQRLIDMYNNNITPLVYQYGSLGASGDLAPLAHMSLPLIGMGEVIMDGEIVSSATVLKNFGWEPIDLQSKEGLALLNGTQFMSAYGVHLCLRVFKLSRLADMIGALSLDAFDGRIEPFHALIQQIRPHQGQIRTAERIRMLLEGSEITNRHKNHIQDPYSFRCIPQVHGASKDSIEYVAYVFRNEINSVTDNPTIFPDEDLIISAGNFHGQPLALAFDNLAIALQNWEIFRKDERTSCCRAHADCRIFWWRIPG